MLLWDPKPLLTGAVMQVIPYHDAPLAFCTEMVHCFLLQLYIITRFDTVSNSGSSYRYNTVTGPRADNIYVRRA